MAGGRGVTKLARRGPVSAQRKWHDVRHQAVAELVEAFLAHEATYFELRPPRPPRPRPPRPVPLGAAGVVSRKSMPFVFSRSTVMASPKSTRVSLSGA